jgi:uncharacterized protein YkwD
MKRLMLWAVLVVASVANAATPPDSEAVEFYNSVTNHYFMTAGAEEARGVDNGAAGPGWTRTGHSFQVWSSQGAAAADARPVCRFYSPGANSHFYSPDATECEWLKGLEADERRLNAASGASMKGWLYEGIAFFVQVPSGGACPPGTQDIVRVYNNGYATGAGSNHRYIDDPALVSLMVGQSWIAERVAFCVATATKSTELAQAANVVVASVNAYRRGQGLQEVAQDAKLTQAARQLAEYMATTGTFSHTADGRQFWDRALQNGYQFCLIFENIAWMSGYSSAQVAGQLFEGWKASPAHNQNMLQPGVTDTGIAIAQSSTGAFYAVQMFGRPSSKC